MLRLVCWDVYSGFIMSSLEQNTRILEHAVYRIDLRKTCPVCVYCSVVIAAQPIFGGCCCSCLAVLPVCLGSGRSCGV